VDENKTRIADTIRRPPTAVNVAHLQSGVPGSPIRGLDIAGPLDIVARIAT
jgi:hypothetical protein